MLFFSPLTIHDFGRFHVIFYTLGFRAFVGSYPPQCSGGVGVVGRVGLVGVVGGAKVQKVAEFLPKTP